MPRSEQGMSNAQARAVRAVACFEAFKGTVVLLAATGLLSLLHRDLHDVAAAFIEHMHLNPASRYPHIFFDLASRVNDSRLKWLAAGAAVYALIRFFEAYGLFRERAWAEVLAASSGAVYVPFEILGLVRSPTWHGAEMLGLNLAIVAIMVRGLVGRRKRVPQNPA